jgi:hypothetical protein
LSVELHPSAAGKTKRGKTKTKKQKGHALFYRVCFQSLPENVG